MTFAPDSSTCPKCGFPIGDDGRTCTFCKFDYASARIKQLEAEIAKLSKERDALKDERAGLLARIQDLRLLGRLEGWSALPIDPDEAS